MHVALTGATGFIGTYTARALHAAGHTIRALARPATSLNHLKDVVDEWRLGDAADPQSLAGLVTGMDVVIHNSADWDALETSPVANFERNVLGSLRLLEAARLAGVVQFLFVSSVAVYHEILPDRTLDETHPTWPSSIYGAYKAAVEPHLKAYHAAYGMNTSSWRPAAVYGVDPHLSSSQWYDLVAAVKQGHAIETSQGGKITYVDDVADALVLAIGDPSTAGEFYNLVDTYMYWQQAAEFTRDLTGSGSRIIDHKGRPKNHFDVSKAIAFFERHGNHTALRRGHEGVRKYIQELEPLIG